MATYPFQLYSVKRFKNDKQQEKESKILTVEVKFSLPGPEEDTMENPLEAPRYSRCVLSIAEKKGLRPVRVIANIPEDDIYYLSAQAETWRHVTTMGRQDGALLEWPEEAFTVEMRSGCFRGKTPAQILLENPGHAAALREQREKLLGFSGKISGYQTIITAIDQALILQEKGELQKLELNKRNLYTAKDRYLLSHTREDGRCLVYNLSMAYTGLPRLPYLVSIDNWYARISETMEGYQVEQDSGKDKVSLDIALSEQEFTTMVMKMFCTMRDFSATSFEQRYVFAHKQAKRKKLEREQNASKTA